MEKTFEQQVSEVIYLDYNATTPIKPEVAAAFQPLLTTGPWANPVSAHILGSEAKELLNKSRKQVASLLGCQESEVVFLSGGSEANNWAVKGLAFSLLGKKKRLICTAFEHPSIKDACLWLEKFGFETVLAPVNNKGVVDIDKLVDAVNDDTFLVSVMHANNEVGSIQDIATISKRVKAKNPTCLIHTDAAQTIGKLRVNVDELGVDMLSVAAHKFYGPRGIGALYLRTGVILDRLIHGASQESGRRAGTDNVIAAVALGAACQIAEKNLSEAPKQLASLRSHLRSKILALCPDARINGEESSILPNTLSVSFPGILSYELLAKINTKVCASAGSACHSTSASMSNTLKAMGVDPHYGLGTLRFSVGYYVTAEQCDRAAVIVAEAVRNLTKKA